MVKFYFSLIASAFFLTSFSQTSTQTLGIINVPSNTATPDVLVGVYPPTDPSTPNRWRFYNYSALEFPWSQVTGAPSFLTAEVDGSVTNEIELPSQTGQSGKVLSTNGTSPQWITAGNGTVTSVGASPGTGISISGSPITSSGSFTITNTAPDQTVVLNSGNGITASGTYPNFTVAVNRTINNTVSRSLNGNFTISTTRDAFAVYSVGLSVTNPLLSGRSTATAFLEYSTNAGSSWTTVSQASNSSSVSLTVTIQISQPSTFQISGYIPANALVRIRTVTSGTASATFVLAQETLM